MHVGIKKITKNCHRTCADKYSIDYYDHNIIKPNQDQFLDDDQFANPQLTEIFFY